jgi:hypothetical protein
MTDTLMTPEKVAELRAPFEHVGKLPKGGMMLDYVGHAAVTARLLKIDPEWTWEPVALDDRGLPGLDREGNLWIKLTILGVTRYGCGDGASMKIRIGDALRNAAMRFGVALDLWGKEELEGAPDESPVQHFVQNQARPAAPSQGINPDNDPISGKPGGVTHRGMRHLMAALAEIGLPGTDKDGQVQYIAKVTGDVVASRNDLTQDQASQVWHQAVADKQELDKAKADV